MLLPPGHLEFLSHLFPGFQIKRRDGTFIKIRVPSGPTASLRGPKRTLCCLLVPVAIGESGRVLGEESSLLEGSLCPVVGLPALVPDNGPVNEQKS